jgi:uncharacterized protein (TIGR02246 family)
MSHGHTGLSRAFTILALIGLVPLAAGAKLEGQTQPDVEALRSLPQAFSTAFNKHDAHQLAAVMPKIAYFFKEDLTWVKGRARFEKYYARLFKNQFKDLSYKVLGTQIRMLRPDLALVRHCWTVQGDKNADGSARPPRFGLMTMNAEKLNGTWVVTSAWVQNTNAPTGKLPGITPEAEGLKPPNVVPRAK